MSYFRSKTMKHYSLVIPRESAWAVMDQLGDLEQIHFVDYDAALPMINRPFANYVKRCDETLLKLQQIEAQLSVFKKSIIRCPNTVNFMEFCRNVIVGRKKAGHTYFDELENEVERKRVSIMEQSNNFQNLQDRANTIVEQQQVLIKCQTLLGESFFNQQMSGSGSADIHDKNLQEIKSLRIQFNQIIGVIDKEDESRFKRMVFRITKGNMWMQVVDIDQQDNINRILDPGSLNPIFKAVFIIVYPGASDSSVMKNKLLRVAETFSRSRFDFPSSAEGYQRKMNELGIQLTETQHLIQLSRRQLESLLDEFVKFKVGGNCSYIEQVRLYVIREKYLYTNLNYLRMHGSIFTGNFWLPEGEDVKVENALKQVSLQNNERQPSGQIQEVMAATSLVPPTYFKLNSVNFAFQDIINTYGVPRYQEVNPALFTVVTFPFIFGVMFGDIGHGFMLFLLGIYLCLMKQSIMASDTMFKLAVPYRYLIIMMGFFAFYNGFIYNDYASIPLNLFGSCYKLQSNEKDEEVWIRKPDCIYPFGLDPVWLASKTAITFINSYKMKLSVIIGVTHMVVGIILKGFNSLYFRNYLDFFCEVIPQMLFMLCTFGWMDTMIIYKWLTKYVPSDAPSIITLMIDQTLSPLNDPNPPLFDAPTQRQIANIMIGVALICVPWILIPKPLILRSRMLKQQHHPYTKIEDAAEAPLIVQRGGSEVDLDPQEFGQALAKAAGRDSMASEHHAEHDFSDIAVHQIIETIEFVLGGISNTASYLRLWALSLAHGQLAEVFYDMFLAGGIESGGVGGGITLALSYYIFANLTFGVLLVMDVMECFLHALRLHWVEFQNKFFKADGYLFVNFSYRKLLEANVNGSEQ